MNETPSPAPRRRWSRWLQLSLRSVLLLTALVAVGCWWFLRARPSETTLLGGYRLRHETMQMKVEGIQVPATVYHGLAEVVDRHGRVRLRGYFERDEPTGRWSLFDPFGRLVLRGFCRDGRRVGTWTGWHDNGRRRFEVPSGTMVRIDKGKFIPLPPDSDENLSAEGDWLAEFEAAYGIRLPRVAVRDGAARAWWDNGRLRYQGQFREDRPDGPWTFWNRNGDEVAAGTIRRGIRHGVWQMRDGVTSARDEAGGDVYYIDGVRYARREQLVARLNQLIAGRDAGDRFHALQLAARMGSDGLPVLRLAVRSDDPRLRRAACRTAQDLGSDALPLVEDLHELGQQHPEHRVDVWLALLAVDADSRAATLARFLKWAADQPDEVRTEALTRLMPLDVLALEGLDEQLDSPDPQVRQTAFEALATLLFPPGNAFWDRPNTSDFYSRMWAMVEDSTRHEDARIAAAAKSVVEHYQALFPNLGPNWGDPVTN